MSGLTIHAAGAAELSAAGQLRGLGCGDCHRLEPRAAGEATLADYAERKGPDLFYAGSKFRPEWLRAWLAQPRPIRPAGVHPAALTKTAAEGDVLADAPAAHPAVPRERIDAVVDALSSLDAGRERLPSEPPARVAVPRALAELNFAKFKGCGSCHRTSPQTAPLSGPDLYDAYERLRPEFLVSYIADPQAWDPVAPMPGYGLDAAEVGKLVEYLRILAEESDDAKAH